jgi:Ni/Fe-hydrogenase subunit HybB-like protein
MSAYKPLGGKIFTAPFIFFLVIFLIGLYFIIERFIFGMGSVSNLNGGFSWGIWVVYDVVIGTAFACGGYAVAFYF